MKRLLFLSVLLLAVLIVAGCSNEPALDPGSDVVESSRLDLDPAAVAAEVTTKAGWEFDAAYAPDEETAASTGHIVSVERELIVDDVVHYYFEVRTGTGFHDVIGLHRVVREGADGEPIRTRKAVFLQHGDGIGFVKFIIGSASANVDDDKSFAVYLAQNNVDVWGIDQNWILVPEATTDFGFMADWDTQNQADNLGIGMAVARSTRLVTGNGWRKIHLLGYSSGANTGYAYLNGETQLPPGLRHVAGYIPVEGSLKTDLESERLANCATAAAHQETINSGVYYDTSPTLFRIVGALATYDPDGASPVVPGLTNYQASLLAGAATYLIAGLECCYHFVAGVFNEFGYPYDLQFTPVPAWNDFLMTAAFYIPLPWQQELSAIYCDEVDLPYDDYLSSINVPVFYVGVGGGHGEKGLYTTTLLGSSDVSSHMISFYPPEAEILDFGHTDLWTATDATMWVWQPILAWINAHTPGNGGKGHFKD